MVILDKNGANLPSCSTMLSSSNGNQYLNPDFLGPLPSETDSKSSPLAMLAKTCSQIGADSNLAPNTKSSQGVLRSSEKLDVGQESRYIPSISPLLHSSKSEDDVGANRSRSSSTEIRVSDSKGIPVSKQSPIPRALSSASSSLSPASNFTSRRGSASPQSQVEIGRKSKSPRSKDATIKETPTSPSMKPASDIFGAPRDHQLRNLGIPDGHSPSRPMFSGASFPPNLFSAASTNPFLASFLASSMATAVTSTSSATTVTSSSSSQCRDPLCRDPSCATFIRNHQLLAAASGGLPSLGAYSSLIQREAILSAQRNAVMAAAAASASPGSAGGPLPFVCNWMGGSDYCGRRFASSEELLLHLKTHTNLSANSDPRAMSMLGPFPPSSPTTPRFHPYARPPGLPGSLASLGLPPGYLNPYASLYPGLFSSRPSML